MNFFKKTGDTLLETIMVLPGSLAFFCLVNEKIVSGNYSEGESMEPTILNPSYMVVDKFLFKWTGIKKGDIVILKSPVDPNVVVCKRVTHLQNEQRYGINIPKNHVWIEGDNKNNSFDSRLHGPVPLCLIKGRIIYSLYPFGSLKN